MSHEKAEPEKSQETARYILLKRLDRLLRVKDELWDERLPIPPELDQKIREVRRLLGKE